MVKVVKQRVGKKKTVKKKYVEQRTATGHCRRVEESDLWGSDNVKINIYGRSGTGKTTLWATFPKPIRVLLRSGGKKPGELRSIRTTEYRRTIKPVLVQEPSDVERYVDEQQRSGEFATFVLEHASGLQDLVLGKILGLEEMPEQLSWGLATQQQYGQCALQMKTHLRHILDLDCNVVIVAQEREFNVDADKYGSDAEGPLLMPYVGSALTPSVTGWLNPACDFICQTFIREATEVQDVTIGKKVIKQTVKTGGIEYCLRTAPDPVYTTKFRLPKGAELPDVIVDPNFSKINKLINQGG